jgi:exonuclease III
MNALIYNIRGFGQQGRRTQLMDYMSKNRLDILGLQETIKQDFSYAELRSLECGSQFNWSWLPAEGHSGGMLLGFRDDFFEVGEWRKGTFFISALILQRSNNMKWCFMLVYGPADHIGTNEFLEELERSVAACPVLIVVGGDFNLIRFAGDKSNGNICWSRARRFNDTIASLSLKEIRRAWAHYMWMNKQFDPIRCTLDRVFVAPAWEACFPRCSLTAITRIGSDHCPLLLSSGRGCRADPRGFSSKPGGSR